jgi:hypothetical protein
VLADRELSSIQRKLKPECGIGEGRAHTAAISGGSTHKSPRWLFARRPALLLWKCQYCRVPIRSHWRCCSTSRGCPASRNLRRRQSIGKLDRDASVRSTAGRSLTRTTKTLVS